MGQPEAKGQARRGEESWSNRQNPQVDRQECG